MVLAIPHPPVLTPAGLKHIAEHKYVAGVYTPLDNLMNPFWYFLTEALPRWLAPNLVTFLGFAPLVVGYACAWNSVPYFNEAPSRALAFYLAAALFFYQTMDCMDGKQARRLGASSPLGQLFDHGCDGLGLLCHHSVTGMVLLPGSSPWTLWGLCGLQTTFFLAQWMEYHTGVLNTAMGAFGVTETEFSLVFTLIFAGVMGPDWIQSTFTAPVQPPWGGPSLPLGIATIKAIVFFFAITSLWGVCMGLKAAFKKGTGVAALWQLVPVLTLNVMACCWHPTALAFPRKLSCITGLLFFFYTAHMILFSMAQMKYPTVMWGTALPYGALVLLSWVLSPEHLSPLLSVACVLICLRVLLWLCVVLDELKNRLGIFALRLGKRKD